MAKKPVSVKKQKMVTDIVVHVFLVIVAIVWLIPFIWIIAHSFRGESTGMYCATFFPKEFTLANYIGLFTDKATMNFPKMFMNTFIIACFTCVISTFFVLAVSYSLSRVKWSMRKSYMDMAMVINLFPGFMSMVAIYFLLKAMGLTEGNRIPIALVICFCAGAGTGFHVDRNQFVLQEADAVETDFIAVACPSIRILTVLTQSDLSQNALICDRVDGEDHARVTHQ